LLLARVHFLDVQLLFCSVFGLVASGWGVCYLLWMIYLLCLWVLGGFFAHGARFQVGFKMCAVLVCSLSALILRCHGPKQIWMKGSKHEGYGIQQFQVCIGKQSEAVVEALFEWVV